MLTSAQHFAIESLLIDRAMVDLDAPTTITELVEAIREYWYYAGEPFTGDDQGEVDAEYGPLVLAAEALTELPTFRTTLKES